LAGTIAANLIAVENGATILRVHDVKETKDMLMVYRGLYD
jgi:dihydropteroate synthase